MDWKKGASHFLKNSFKFLANLMRLWNTKFYFLNSIGSTNIYHYTIELKIPPPTRLCLKERRKLMWYITHELCNVFRNRLTYRTVNQLWPYRYIYTCSIAMFTSTSALYRIQLFLTSGSHICSLKWQRVLTK